MTMTMTKGAQQAFERAFTQEVSELALTDRAAFERTARLMLNAFQLGREHGHAEVRDIMVRGMTIRDDNLDAADDAVAAITDEEIEDRLDGVLRQAGYCKTAPDGGGPSSGDQEE